MGKYLSRGSETVEVKIRIDMSVYKKLMKLKICGGDEGSFNKWLNRELAKLVNDNAGIINGYKVDDVDSDF